jgi:hypothetical protein
MAVEVHGINQVIPFGMTRMTVVIPSLGGISDSPQSSGDEVRVLRGNTADETVSSIFLPEYPSNGKD